MTEQQTAADNALVEKLVREDRPPFYDQGMGAFIHYYRNPDGPEAAERIKSLQAEVQRTRDYWYRQGKDDAFETYEADRQRMRDAIQEALLRCSMSNNMRAELCAALNPASKEANDG